MKLLIATPLYPPDIGGPATYAKLLQDELPKQNIVVEVVSFHTVRHLPKGIAHVVYLGKLLRLGRGFDVILSLDPVSVGFPAMVASFILRKKFVVKVVGDYAWEQGSQRFSVKELLDEFVKTSPSHYSRPVRMLRFLQTRVVRRAVAIIVPSDYLKGIVVAWGIPPDRIHVIYNAFGGVPELSDKETLRKKFDLSGTILLSAGRLVPWKGFETLVSLMSKAHQTIPDAKLYIAGSGPLEGKLKQQVAEHKLEQTVFVLGALPREMLLEYIRAADVFVLNTGYEGLSHQLLEVLAVGCPIVTTNVGGNPELIKDAETGFLVPYNDRSALSFAISRLIKEKETAIRFVSKGKTFVAEFSKERMINETISVLINTLNEHPCTRS